jgi:hypothetical protein
MSGTGTRAEKLGHNWQAFICHLTYSRSQGFHHHLQKKAQMTLLSQ